MKNYKEFFNGLAALIPTSQPEDAAYVRDLQTYESRIIDQYTEHYYPLIKNLCEALKNAPASSTRGFHWEYDDRISPSRDRNNFILSIKDGEGNVVGRSARYDFSVSQDGSTALLDVRNFLSSIEESVGTIHFDDPAITSEMQEFLLNSATPEASAALEAIAEFTPPSNDIVPPRTQHRTF